MQIFNKIKPILYCIMVIMFYFYLFIFSSLYGTINIFSKILFIIVYLLIPILILILPIIIKCLLKKEINITKNSLILIILHLVIILILRYSIILYMKHFTIDKWNNPNWIQLRYLMLDDFKNKYKPIGKDKDEITKILGNYDYVNEECICYDVRLYKDIVYDTYCLYYNIDNIIIDTSKTWK